MPGGTINTCSGNFYDTGGSGGNYANSQNVTTTFCSNAGNCVQVAFSSFNLENNWDFLYIYDGPTTGSPIIGTYTGTTSPGTVTSTSGCLTFRFTSDGSVVAAGWAASISCVACPPPPPPGYNMPGGTINTCSGNFYDTGGSGGNYANNQNITTTFCSNAGNCIQVAFSSFNVETCCDRLYIYDGPTAGSPQVPGSPFTTNPGTIISTTGCLTFRFTSDGSVVAAGWAATLSCVPCPPPPPPPSGYYMPGGTINTCTGDFYDTGGPGGQYANSENITTTFCSNAGNCIQVAFSSFNVETCCDMLYIYDGPTTGSPQVPGSPFSTNNPGTITSTSGCLTFRFTSDGSVVAAGWAATLSCVPCPPPPPPACYAVSAISYAPDPFNAGTSITLSDDAISGVLPIGFSFCFFGNSYTQFYIGSNGWIGFSGGQTTAYTSSTIPSTIASVPKNCIMGPWQDWHPGVAGGPYIRYQTLGVAPNRRLVVSFNNCPMFSCTTELGTFQMTIYETSNNIENHILNKPNCTSWAGGTAVQGIHDDTGANAVTVPGRNSTQWTTTSQSYRFTPSCVACVPLPIELLSFNGEYNGKSVDLKWETASEINNDYFTVEKSIDGLNYEIVTTVRGAGNSNNVLNYNTVDYQPYEGISYYKLKQTDFDGKFEYSDIISVRVEKDYPDDFAVQPNPFTDKIDFTFNSDVSVLSLLTIYNITGQVVFSEKLITSKGYNEVKLDLAGFQKGVYFLTLSSNYQNIKTKLIKY